MRCCWQALLKPVLVLVAGIGLQASALGQVGLRQLEVPGGAREPKPTLVALYYPSAAVSREMPMGPFVVRGAWQAEPAAQLKGLILLSHGTGGSERGHSKLAEALAEAGYLVAALRHPGDNWQDTSLRESSGPGDYFRRRPLQVSQVLDWLLQDPLWRTRLQAGERAPRVGALGHSAGGYTVLALAGGQPETNRIVQHCTQHGESDPIFCSLTREIQAEPDRPRPSLADPRIQAVAALAPLGALFEPQSLTRISVPALLVEAGSDRFLVPRFHSGWIAQHLVNAQRVVEPNAWHFVFMDTPRMPLPSPDGDVGANPPGFDRSQFLAKLAPQLVEFFDRALR